MRSSLTAPPTGPSFFSRMLDAMVRARQEQVEREIFAYLHGYGSKLTDETERKIECQFLHREQL